MKGILNHNGKDHDLLIQIDTKLERVIIDVKELRDNTVARVNHLEDSKIDKEEVLRLKNEADQVHKDFETRIRRLERYGAIGATLLAVAQVVLNMIK